MEKERNQVLGRMFLVFGLVFLLPCAIMFQVFRVNVVEGDGLRELWSEQAVDFMPIQAQRGDILDRNQKIMVTNSIAYNVAIDPLYRGVNQETFKKVSQTLAKYSNRGADHFLKKIKLAPRGSRYVVLAKGLGPSAYRDLQELGVRGLIIDQQYKRRYNYDSLA